MIVALEKPISQLGAYFIGTRLVKFSLTEDLQNNKTFMKLNFLLKEHLSRPRFSFFYKFHSIYKNFFISI